MKLFVTEVIIWPEDGSHEPRRVGFDPNKISIVTGWSATGKSALVAIIDYVLGANSCAIPVGVIREKASWFGLSIETDAGPMRLARKKPEGRQVSNAYWLQQPGDETELPGRPVQNASADRVRNMMDVLSGLSNLETDPDDPTGFSGRASFRDMASFNFLPQHIVANPYTMFFKTDSSEHREKLRNVLPLAMGSITNDELLRRHELRLLRDEQRRLEAELGARRAGLESWRAGATGAFYRAQELTLLPPGDVPGTLEGVIDTLRGVVSSGGRHTFDRDGQTAESATRLESIRRDEENLDRSIAEGKRRLRRLKSLRSTVTDFGDVLIEQHSRVRGVGWFREHIGHDECILCGAQSDASRRSLSELEQPVRELEELNVGRVAAAPVVDREILDVQRQIALDERRLQEAQRTRRELETLRERETGTSLTLESIYRFIGGTEQALTTLQDIQGEGGLESQLLAITRRISALNRQSDEAGRKSREAAIRTAISSYIERFVEAIGVAGAEGRPVLDERELNLKFEHDGGAKPDLLWEIGSGENWMAYHLATLLALHGTFLARGTSNPVPTFLVIDQPSQVYFPSDTFDQAQASGTPSPRKGREHLDDLASTTKIFEALARARKAFDGRLQIIVLDHADRNAWGQIADMHQAQNWRGDADSLVPAAWL